MKTPILPCLTLIGAIVLFHQVGSPPNHDSAEKEIYPVTKSSRKIKAARPSPFAALSDQEIIARLPQGSGMNIPRFSYLIKEADLDQEMEIFRELGRRQKEAAVDLLVGKSIEASSFFGMDPYPALKVIYAILGWMEVDPAAGKAAYLSLLSSGGTTGLVTSAEIPDLSSSRKVSYMSLAWKDQYILRPG